MPKPKQIYRLEIKAPDGFKHRYSENPKRTYHRIDEVLKRKESEERKGRIVTVFVSDLDWREIDVRQF